MARKSRSLLLAASLLAGLMPAALGRPRQTNTSDQTVIRISANLVQVDVVVVDKMNKPVTGLTRDDFQVFDNNKPQSITYFSYQGSTSAFEAPGGKESRSNPRTLAASDVKRALAFVVDTLHAKPESVYRTRQMLDDFIDNKMQLGDLVLILPTAGGSGVVQQFTSDRRILHRAVDRLRPFFLTNDTTPHRSSRLASSVLNGPSSMGGSMSRRGRVPTMMTQPPTTLAPLSSVDPLEEADVRATLLSLNNLIREMRKLPGRKLGVFVSEGLRIFQTDTDQDLRITTDLAARSGVVLYTVDPRGLDPLTINASDDPAAQGTSPIAFLSQTRNDYLESQDSLNAIARDTGGQFFHDNNDIKVSLSAVLEQNPGYYLLGFQPNASKWDGKYHKLKVAVVGKPGLTVLARAGYVASDEKPKAEAIGDPNILEKVEAINSPLVRRDIDLQLTPFYKDDAKRDPMMVTLLHIDTRQLHFKQVDGRYQDKLDISGFMIDTNGKPVDSFSDVLDMKFLPKSYEASLKEGILSTRAMSVKPGIYQMRVLVEETDTKMIGTANNYVEVPDLKADRLVMSSIFTLPERPEPGAAASEEQGGTLSQRRFKRGSRMDYAFIVYNAVEGRGGNPQLEMRARLLKGMKVVYSGPPVAVQALQGSTPPNRIVAGAAIALGSELTPDDYTLEITVTDKLAKKENRGVARQQIDFTVE
ncbi:MAG TPA: VWA domain-containing protein [Blastocatellia bacterium]|nr:VWA domain-containing protein [Blastocatellia bacterium]